MKLSNEKSFQRAKTICSTVVNHFPNAHEDHSTISNTKQKTHTQRILLLILILILINKNHLIKN